ncbi:Hypothetical Protein OBI_RACECAR_216 [Arthrobacter phage Racecar]|nr:hypothetical protein PBI_RACECAR_8 [Arthrobacter phage Racecar]QFG12693.1 hypothetical protein PBI_MIMI_8 [Arthrobacter phage Mimi]
MKKRYEVKARMNADHTDIISGSKHTAFTRWGALHLARSLNGHRRWFMYNSWHYYVIDHKTGEVIS